MRYFKVWILGGESPGPFNIYNDSVDYPTNNNLSTLYNSTDKAENIAKEELTNGNSVNIQTPDDVNSIILYDVLYNSICPYYATNTRCKLDVEITNIEELTPSPTNTDCTLLIPEDFSPNDDDIYDVFEILNLDCYPVNEMYIYSGTSEGTIYRDLMFHTKSYHVNSWNGKFFNYGDNCPDGYYTWILYIDNDEFTRGTVKLIR